MGIDRIRPEMTHGPVAGLGLPRHGRMAWVIPVNATVLAAAATFAVITAPIARADTLAYLVNIAIRPGYNFTGADAALSYGQGVCQEIAHGRRYADILDTIRSELSLSDDYQAAYLTSQAANELCPQLIWQLRNSAADYRPAAP